MKPEKRVKPCGLTKKSTAVPGTSGPPGADRVKFWNLIIFASGVDEITCPLNVFRNPSNLATNAEEGELKTASASSLQDHLSRGNDDHPFDQLVSLLWIVGTERSS